MTDQAFVVMQVGAKDSLERKRADEIYSYIIVPALEAFDISPYRADLDPSPGPITPKMLSELVGARLVIAHLTGRNPNVFYELGIVHSFARPLISIADSAKMLPFDAKDERVIELGEYPSSGLPYAQGEIAKKALMESLGIVLADDYAPPSPLKEVAANQSVDQLAPDNPMAAEMSQMREALEEIRTKIGPRYTVPKSFRADITALRMVIERNLNFMDESDFEILSNSETSEGQDSWVEKIRAEPQHQSDEPPF